MDALTVNPYLGPETLEPFINTARIYGKAIFVLVKTSNPGSGWLQDKMIGGMRVSDRVAELVAKWADETRGASGSAPSAQLSVQHIPVTESGCAP